jgi:hypothetical protein
MSDQSDAEASTRQHKHSKETNIHAPGGIRTRNPSKRMAADLRLRPRGHWDRHRYSNMNIHTYIHTHTYIYIDVQILLVSIHRLVSADWTNYTGPENAAIFMLQLNTLKTFITNFVERRHGRHRVDTAE